LESRVHHAPRTTRYEMDLRCAGIEALISTGTNDLSWQFRHRVAQLANEFGS
jgi:hypothetical protein